MTLDDLDFLPQGTPGLNITPCLAPCDMVSTWKKRKYVVQMADGSFQKSDRYKNK